MRSVAEYPEIDIYGYIVTKGAPRRPRCGPSYHRRDIVLLGQVFWGWRVAKLGAIRSEDGVVRAVEVFHRDVARTGNGAGQTG